MSAWSQDAADFPGVLEDSDSDDGIEDDDGDDDDDDVVTTDRVQQLLGPYVKALYGQDAQLKPEQAEFLSASVNKPRLDMLFIASYVNLCLICLLPGRPFIVTVISDLLLACMHAGRAMARA